jgi:hypothetical protein
MQKAISDNVVLVAAGFALLLAVLTVLTSSVPYLDAADWGLLTRLPIFYWGGVATTVLTIIFSLCNKSGLNVRNSLVVLLLIMIFLNIVPTLVEQPVGLSLMSLWPSSQANQLVATGHITIGQSRLLMDYSAWPFSTIFTAILMELTGLSVITLAKWFPLFTVSLWGLLVFIILRKFLRPEYALVGVSLFLCGSWTRQQYFGPQSFAFIFYLLFIFLATKSPRFRFGVENRKFLALTLLVFIGAVFSHALTSLMVLLIMISSYVFTYVFARHEEIKNKSNLVFCLLCGTIVVSYTLFIASYFFKDAYSQLMDALNNIFGVPVISQLSRLPGSPFQQMTNMATYALVFSLGIVSLIGLLHVMRKRSLPKTQLTFWIGMLLVLLFVSIMPYGGSEEGAFRAFIFGLPIFSLLSVYYLRNKPKVLALFFTFVFIVSIPALYGSDSYRLATPTELQGAEFCSTYMQNNALLFYKFTTYVRYFDTSHRWIFSSLGRVPFLSYNVSTTEANFKASNYIALSRDQVNYYDYYLGRNPFSDVDITGQPLLGRARIYDNGNFTIYSSNQTFPYDITNRTFPNNP